MGENAAEAARLRDLEAENERLNAQLRAAQEAMNQARQNALNNNNNNANREENQNRPIRDFTAPDAIEIRLGYAAPTIAAEDYQISPQWISMVQRNQFHGNAHEDATQHLANFEELCLLSKCNAINRAELKVMAFSFSLADKAKSWIHNQRPENMDTWAKVANQFLNKFFSPSKTNKLR